MFLGSKKPIKNRKGLSLKRNTPTKHLETQVEDNSLLSEEFFVSDDEILLPTQKLKDIEEPIETIIIDDDDNLSSIKCMFNSPIVSTTSLSFNEEKLNNNSSTNSFNCPICTKDITSVNNFKRSSHVNRCIKLKDLQTKSIDQKSLSPVSAFTNIVYQQKLSSVSESSKTISFTCKICGNHLNVKSLFERISHIKKCGKIYGIRPQDLFLSEIDKDSEKVQDKVQEKEQDKVQERERIKEQEREQNNVQEREKEQERNEIAPQITQNYIERTRQSSISSTLEVKNAIPISDTLVNESSLLTSSSSSSSSSVVKNAFSILMKTAQIQQRASSMLTGITRQVNTFYNKRNFSSNSWKKTTPCPDFKKIEGTKPPIIVDGFQYASSSLSNCYFLSHFHSDHYIGLSKTFNFGIIYCSSVTSNLIQLHLRINSDYIKEIPMNTPYLINGIQVILIDANHCPGAAIFLFKLRNGKHVLHTGDFRYDKLMANHPALLAFTKRTTKESQTLDICYLDTTYCDPKYSFPSQKQVIQHVLLLMETLVKSSRTLYLFGSYTIGKEKLFLEVGKKFNLKVYVESSKYKTLSCLEWSKENMDILTKDKTKANIFVVPMGHLNFDKISSILSQTNGKYDKVAAFRPTGWSYSPKTGKLLTTRKQNNMTIYGVPYSEHSSFKELRLFLSTFRPQKIIPTVNCSTKQKSQKQIDLLQNSCFNQLIQQTINT